jgi:hypothetical protein
MCFKSKLERTTEAGITLDAPMRERPSDDMIDERLAAWQAGDYPEGWSVYDALGWSRDEYMTWLNDPSRVPERPLSALPDPEIYAPLERHEERVESA